MFLCGCVAARLIQPTQVDVDRVQTKYPGYTLADLNHGKELFEQNCGSCHRLRKPSSRTEEKWTKVVPKMVEKVNKKKKAEVLSAKDEDLILKYVLTMRDAKK